jgi:hypothetical protein
VNSTLFNNMCWQFQKIWREVHGDGLDCLLFFDNLACHNSMDLHCALMAKGIYPMGLPRYSSAFLQPLDDAVFAARKSSTAVTHQYLTEARLVQGKSIARLYGVCAALTEPVWLKPMSSSSLGSAMGWSRGTPSSSSSVPSRSASIAMASLLSCSRLAGLPCLRSFYPVQAS